MTEKEKLIEILHIATWNTCLTDNEIETIADYLLKNGVSVPFCGISETVYLSLTIQKVLVGVVTGFRITEFSKYAVIYLQDDKRYTEIPFNAFGKTVFLTKKEAEDALRKENVR